MHKPTTRTIITCWSGILAVGAMCGCGEAEREDGSALESSASAPIGETSDSADDGPGDDDDDSSPQGSSPQDDDDGQSDGEGSDGDPRFDLGANPDGGELPPPELGCNKIDFLFVIDSSTSMEDEQANLIANFSTFIDGIRGTLADVDDFHVGVISTDAYGFNTPECAQLGGLIAKTGGMGSSNATCGPYAEGGNYMTEADNLDTSFSCAAQVGTQGWPLEVPMDALTAALDGGPGACNEGFLRGDALLVAVIITDEWDGPGDPEVFPSQGDPASWYDTVLAAKTFEENVAIVSLLNYAGGECEPAEAGFDGHHIKTFTELFPHGFVGGVCADYGPIFSQAVGVVDDACKNFLPPG